MPDDVIHANPTELGRPAVAKPNVNTASRDKLVEAGVRADLVDEIMKRRRRKGGITLEALGEVQGVGPATLEQLGKALDFKEPPSDDGAKVQDKLQPPQNERPTSERRGDDQTTRQAPQPAEKSADATEATLRAGTEQAADLVATVQAGAEARGRATDTVRGAVETGVRAADQVVRAGPQVVQRTAEAAEETQRKVVEHSADGGATFARTFLELLQEQSQENMAAMAALARAQGLDEVVRVQGEYLHGTLERMTELNRRWLELAGTMWPGVVMGEDRGSRDGASPAARSSDQAAARR
jgi:hypothetical protein